MLDSGLPAFPSNLHYMSGRLNQINKHITNKMAVVPDKKTPDITLYTTQTPNGIKISIALEELGYAHQQPRSLRRLC